MSYFPDVPKIAYEGPDSKNPLAFRHYNPDEVIVRAPSAAVHSSVLIALV